MATFLRQSDCGGEPDANPNRLRDPDAISRSVKSNKIFTQILDPDGKGSHMKVHFIFNEDKNFNPDGPFNLVLNYGVTSLYVLDGIASDLTKVIPGVGPRMAVAK